uniref:Uncharacterized protein n=1 Tax=Romanomermis culicivorax TaxID=13658 RepID=A0A915IPC1_ROMCU
MKELNTRKMFALLNKNVSVSKASNGVNGPVTYRLATLNRIIYLVAYFPRDKIMFNFSKIGYVIIVVWFLSVNAQANDRPFKLRHLDKMVVKRILQILRKKLDTVENGALVAEPLKKFKPKIGVSKEMREKVALLKRFDQAINNGVLATPVKDVAFSKPEKRQTSLSASKIAHQLDHSTTTTVVRMAKSFLDKPPLLLAPFSTVSTSLFKICNRRLTIILSECRILSDRLLV